jgi:hypothetical protein
MLKLNHRAGNEEIIAGVVSDVSISMRVEELL